MLLKNVFPVSILVANVLLKLNVQSVKSEIILPLPLHVNVLMGTMKILAPVHV